MIDDDDDDNEAGAGRRSLDQMRQEEDRARGRRRVAAVWGGVVVVLAIVVVLSMTAGDSKAVGALVWLFSGVLAPCALLAAFSTGVRLRRVVPSKGSIALLVASMLALLGYGLYWAWDVARRFL